jgi:plastocyanin
MRFRRASCFAVLVVALAAASPVAAGVVHVDMKGIGFTPAKVSAKVGDIVEWTNHDFVVHSATARDNSFDVNVTASKSGRTVLKKAGKIAYYCRYHPNMTAEIDVVAK